MKRVSSVVNSARGCIVITSPQS